VGLSDSNYTLFYPTVKTKRTFCHQAHYGMLLHYQNSLSAGEFHLKKEKRRHQTQYTGQECSWTLSKTPTVLLTGKSSQLSPAISTCRTYYHQEYQVDQKTSKFYLPPGLPTLDGAPSEAWKATLHHHLYFSQNLQSCRISYYSFHTLRCADLMLSALQSSELALHPLPTLCTGNLLFSTEFAYWSLRQA